MTSPTTHRPKRARRPLSADGVIQAAWMLGNAAAFALLGQVVASELDQPATATASVEKPDATPDTGAS